MKEARQLGLLMWKHYHLRKHRWFMTVVEICLPIFVAYMFCSQGSKFTSGTIHHNATRQHPVNVNDIISKSFHYDILYAPKNSFSDQLFQRVREFAAYSSVDGYVNEQEMIKVLANHSRSKYGWMQNSIGVVFLNLENNETKPAKWTYKIRSSNSWFTEMLYPERLLPGPYAGDPYLQQGFAGLQMVLDIAYIRQWNKDFKFDDIHFEPFPYPEYEEINMSKTFVSQIICLTVIVTTLLLSAPLISHIIEEKESGVKELMKLVGVSEWLIQFSWFLNAIMFSFFSFTIVSFLLKYNFQGPGTAILTNVPFSIIWTCIILYCIANIAFCFMFCAIFHSTTVATSVFSLVFFLLIYATSKITSINSLFIIRLMCIFPLLAFNQGFQRIGYFENHNVPITWSSLNQVEDETKGVSLFFVLLVLIFDTILYFLLTYYISCINPGSFGSKKSPLFFLEMLWPSSRHNASEELIDMDDNEETKYFEPIPKNLKVSIHIRDLYKKFGSFVAIKGMNLKVCQGEITALLGHNGAGKTTTIAILTGMMKPNAGSITYNNDMDVLSKMSQFRENLGMCPQEDRLFPYLSVFNHLLFFGLLKGGSKSDVTKEADSYLRLMEMKDKKNDLSRSLSGGMKRKLCLAISLMGNSQTLILDEPTSGLDVESRRKIWDLLLELRGSRTIILSTHHMEEADVLGDRIAIMHHGSVVCHGTTMFLKKVYATGYKLTVTITQEESALTNVIKSLIPNVEEKKSGMEIVYNLPLTESAKFPELFRKLENNTADLGIKNMGVTCTTMEQVFLKVGGASIYDIGRRRNSTVTDGILLSEHSKNKKTGLFLIFQQLQALLWKKCLFTKRKIIMMCYRILLPSLIIVSLLYSANAINKEGQPLSLTLSSYPDAKIMLTDYRSNPSSLFNSALDYIQKNGDTVVFVNSTNIVNDLLDYSRKNLNSFETELLLAADFNPSNVMLFYNKFGVHSLPILINTISNLELALLSNSNNSIETINSPLKSAEVKCSFGQDEIAIIIILFVIFVFFTIDLTFFFTTFLSTERIDGFKHIQLMSSVSPLVYWFSNLVFDFLFIFTIILLRIILVKVIDDNDGFLSFAYPFDIFLLLLCGYIVSGLLFSYVVNFISNSKEGSYTLLFFFSTIGIIVSVLFYLIERFHMFILKSLISNQIPPEELMSQIDTIWWIVYYFVKYLVLLIPPLNFSISFIKYTMIWFGNRMANKPACAGQKINVEEYLVFASETNPNGFLLEIICMMINIILYSALLAFIEAGYMGHLLNKIIIHLFGEKVRESNTEPMDLDVEHERQKVNELSKQLAENLELNLNSIKRNSDVEKNLDSDSDANETIPLNRANTRNAVVIAQELKKVFVSKTLKPFVAVENVNFVVNNGECFGLLGVNGAGKSTTFKMLTAIQLPTKGDSYIYNIRLCENKAAYLSKAGYCAQTNCFIEELTGREMLKLIASLRGVRSPYLNPIVDKWLSILGLESYQNRRCGRYSGGNKRKLCTAMSLIGDPSVVFLDEPTTGVDPVSRRKLYDVMDHSKLSGQAVVLTSHSMEECENLCDRLSIMAKGRMKCIGTVQHLKQRYAQGFSILIKTHDMLEESEEKRRIVNLKNAMDEIFGKNFCNLKDEHKGLLYYQITNVALKWSELFENLRNLKHNNNIVEDYTVTDTTLEEVFISFAK